MKRLGTLQLRNWGDARTFNLIAETVRAGKSAMALASPFLLDQRLFPGNLGWRLG
jgi:hypothetical protein